MSGIRILISGDVHIGRSSSRVPADAGVDVSARGAWDRLVDAAIRQEVGLLCLTGDVADEHNRYWEAIGPLEAGVRRLAERGIRTLAVAGNHDHDVLPRLAERLDPAAFELLGRNGRWERFTHAVDGRPIVHIDGWSFPQERVRSSPLGAYAPEADPRVPTLAMVHGDLDVPGSAYAPLDRGEMLARPVAGWLLGHIHAPMRVETEGRPFITYPGSPQAMDPGERGPHGAVLAEVLDGRVTLQGAVPLSTVRYDEIAVDMDGAEDVGEFDRRILDACEAHAAVVATAGGDALALLSLRLCLVGRTPLAAVAREEAGRVVSGLDLTASGIRITVDQIRRTLRPAIDLHEHATADTPPGMLARLLLELDAEEAGAGSDARSAETQRILAEARERMGQQRRDATYADISDGERTADDAEVRRVVREQADALLTRLLEPVS